MKKTGQLIASAAVAALAMGTLGSGFLVLSTTGAVAKSDNGSSGGGNGGSHGSSGGSDHGNGGNSGAHGNSASHPSNAGGNSANAGSNSHGKGKYHRASARYLKRLNAMCSNGKSQSPNSNVYKINFFYTQYGLQQQARTDLGGAFSDLQASVTYDGTAYGSLTDTSAADAALSDAIAKDGTSSDPLLSFDATAMDAYLADQTALAKATQDTHDALAAAVGCDSGATALDGADPTSPEGIAYQTFLNHCADPSNG